MTILTFLLTFIQLHWSDVLVVIGFMAAMAVLWKKGHKALVKKIVRALVIKAEKQLGSKTGVLKKELAYDMLPWILKIILTREDVSDIIDKAADWLDKKLKENPDMNLLSYEEERKVATDE